jgi:hypothetical protein
MKKDWFEELIKRLGEQGYKNIKAMPDSILTLKFPDSKHPECTWQFFCNANSEPRKIVADEWGEIELGPFDFAVFWNGWLAGLFNPRGGQMAAHHEGANIENLIASIPATAVAP